MPTFASNWPAAILRAALRSTYSSGYTFNQVALNAGGTGIKYRNISGTDWASASGGVAVMAPPNRSTVHLANGTIDTALLHMGSLSSAVTGLTVATASPGELLADDLVITAAEACNITKFSLGFVEARSTVKISTTLRNKMCDILTGKSAAHFSANGTIKVYSGSAPASADDAPTGTELWSVNTDQTSSFTWNDVTANNCVLAANLVATSLAFGANQTVGYARLKWTHSAVDYVIQGSVGEATGDFQFVNLDGGGNNEMIQSTSYTMNNATIGF